MEGAEYRDKLLMAKNTTQITTAARLSQNILSNMISIAGLSVIIFLLDSVFVLVILATLATRGAFVFFIYKFNEKLRKLHAQNDRIGNYLNHLALYDQGAAKELRVNNIGNWFMKKMLGYRNEMVRLQYAGFKRHAIYDSIAALIMSLQSLRNIIRPIRSTKCMES
jgi:hypothetical protein